MDTAEFQQNVENILNVGINESNEDTAKNLMEKLGEAINEIECAPEREQLARLQLYRELVELRGELKNELRRFEAQKEKIELQSSPRVAGVDSGLYYNKNDYSITFNQFETIGLVDVEGDLVLPEDQYYIIPNLEEGFNRIDEEGTISQRDEFAESIPNLEKCMVKNAIKNLSHEFQFALPRGEMYFQQLVCSPFSLLFMAAATTTTTTRHGQHFNYVADQEVHSSLLVKFKEEGDDDEFQNGSITMKPDSASFIWNGERKCDVFGMMEIKPKDNCKQQEYKTDKIRCILATAATARLLYKYFKHVAVEHVALPFIIVTGTSFSLYVTRLKQNGQPFVSKVNLLDDSGSLNRPCNQSPSRSRAKMFVALALLLNQFLDFFDDTRRNAYEDKRSGETIPDARKIFTSSKRKTDGESSNAENKKPKVNDDNNDDKKIASSGTSNNKSAESKAALAAACNGRFSNIKYPFVRELRLTDSVKLEQQTRYPFYFTGLACNDTAESKIEKVFLKVWKSSEVDNLKLIQEELHLQSKAHEVGVPVAAPCLPKVESVQIQDGTEYYVMATEYLQYDKINTIEDFFQFSLSLIKTVNALHNAGILHCDLKPENVRWSGGTVKLIDFGHAQLLDENARHYSATRGFEAPEILAGSPHTPATDAFAVGKTILNGIDAFETTTGLNLILKDVAERLAADDMKNRWSLGKALKTLISRSGKFEKDFGSAGQEDGTQSPPHKLPKLMQKTVGNETPLANMLSAGE